MRSYIVLAMRENNTIADMEICQEIIRACQSNFPDTGIGFMVLDNSEQCGILANAESETLLLNAQAELRAFVRGYVMAMDKHCLIYL